MALSTSSDAVEYSVRPYDATDAVVVVTIRGDGEPVTPAPIEELALDDGALVVRVNDRRDVTVDTETNVSFADPDEAVRERVRDLGLSEAARGIDETVRESAVADSNVRDTVEKRVRDIVDDDALDAFVSADDATGQPDDASEDPADGAEEPVGAAEYPTDSSEDPTDAAEEPATVDTSAADGAGDGDDQSSMGEFL